MPLGDCLILDVFDFGTAIKAAKSGKGVSRLKWQDGEPVVIRLLYPSHNAVLDHPYLFKTTVLSLDEIYEIHKHDINLDNFTDYLKQLDDITYNDHDLWNPTMEDILAEDWFIYSDIMWN